MKNEFEIYALWIDDINVPGNFKGKAFMADARNNGIIITPASSVEEGMEKLLDSSLSFDAVILDVDCYINAGENRSTTPRALNHALREMLRNNIDLPYFIYSGYSDAQEVVDLVMAEDDFRIYRKPLDKKELFADIRRSVLEFPDHKLKKKYANAFGIVSSGDLLKLLRAFESNDSISDTGIVTLIRPLYEQLARYLDEQGLISLSDARKIQKKKTSANISKDCSIFIDLETYERKFIPTHIKRLFHMVSQCANECMHSYAEKNNDWTGNRIPNMLKRGDAPYLNKILVYGFLEILAWVKRLPVGDAAWKNSWQTHFQRLSKEKIH